MTINRPTNDTLMEYLAKLTGAARQSESLLCVGLDPNPALMPARLKESYEDPAECMERFCMDVIEATEEHCCAYKPNLAFFEALGPDGLAVFERILGRIPEEKVVIADAKRGDIRSTAEQYKKAFFDHYKTDAITLNPMMGFDTLDPFLHQTERAVYVLVLTSNPGSKDLLLRPFEGRSSLAEHIAEELKKKMNGSSTHIGMVIGATHDRVLKQVLAACPEASLLIPGIGSQGGNVEALARLLEGHRGIPVITSSRSIIYAGKGDDWKSGVAQSAAAAKEALKKITARYV